MKTELQVLDCLKDLIAADLANFLDTSGEAEQQSFGSDNIKIDFPDVDKMKKSTMLFIQPDYESIEDLSMNSDIATLHTTLFIFCKAAPSEILIRRVFNYYTAFYTLLRSNQTLNGFIDFSKITDMDYYPAVAASSTTTAIEVKLQLQWAKQF